MELPPADPAKLLAAWADGLSGESTPGRAVADLKTAGLRDILDHESADGLEGASSRLATWMTWERGEADPGRVLGELAEAGLGERLTALAASAAG